MFERGKGKTNLNVKIDSYMLNENLFEVGLVAFIGAFILSIIKVSFHWKYLKLVDKNYESYTNYFTYRVKNTFKEESFWQSVALELPFFVSLHSDEDGALPKKIAIIIKILIVLIWGLVFLCLYCLNQIVELSLS